MSLTPDYGETLLPHDELDALLPTARSLLTEPITKAAIYDLEQAVEAEVKEKYLNAVLEDELAVDKLLDDHFVRKLHGELYGEIWTWAGVFRKTEANIGIAPEWIAVELRSSLGTIRHRWKATEDWTAHQLGIAVMQRRSGFTRLLTEMAGRPVCSPTSVFFAAQAPEKRELYDWELDRAQYIELLRQYDGHRNPDELAAFVGIHSLE